MTARQYGLEQRGLKTRNSIFDASLYDYSMDDLRLLIILISAKQSLTISQSLEEIL